MAVVDAIVVGCVAAAVVTVLIPYALALTRRLRLLALPIPVAKQAATGKTASIVSRFDGVD